MTIDYSGSFLLRVQARRPPRRRRQSATSTANATPTTAMGYAWLDSSLCSPIATS